MSVGFLSIGLTGLRAASLGLSTTDHNITNATTPGYSRQTTVQAAAVAISNGAGTVGQGTEVQTIKRAYDQFITRQLNTAQSNLSWSSAYYAQISQIDNLLADSSAGLSPTLQAFFNSVQDVTDDPSSLAARQTMVSSAQTMINRYQAIQSRVDELSEEVNGKIRVSVSNINAITSQIGQINQSIRLVESAYNQPANDLRDQRDKLVNDLSKLVNVNVVTGSDGSFNLFIGSGQRLVSENTVSQLTAQPSALSPNRIVVGLQTVGGAQELPEHLLAGGELGGILTFRTEAMDTAVNELGRVAASMALTFNAQHALGQDLLGNANGDLNFVGNFFDMTNMQPQTTAYAKNTGTEIITANFTPASFGPEVTNGNFYTLLTTSDYRLDNLGAGNYALIRLSDNATLANGTLATVDTAAQTQGFTIASAGAGNAGDSFYIRPTANAAINLTLSKEMAADPRRLAVALPFRTLNEPLNTGTGIISSGISAPGFSTANFPTDVTWSYNAATNTLDYAGIPAGSVITFKAGVNPEQNVAAVAGGSIPFTQGMSVSVNGMTFTLSGQPNTGDRFTLTRNTGANADGRNGLALGLLQTQNTVGGDLANNKANATLQTAYAGMVAYIGVKTNEVMVASDAQEVIFEQASANRESVAGVNLDEEYVNMVKFQQAYQASARIIEVAGVIFDTIVNLR